MPTRKAAVSAPAVVPKMTVAQAVRDVLIASINKGQFPFAVIGLIVLLLIWRLPEGEVAVLVNKMIDRLVSGHLVGWLLFAIATFCWFFHAQFIRRELTEEVDRLNAAMKKRRSSGNN